VLVLPDCFGFSGNLPQILKQAGISYFVTAKLSWSEYTQYPHSTFLWRGIDGTDVVTHFVTTPVPWDQRVATYTGESTAFQLMGTLEQYKQRDILPISALHTSGRGDGGGGLSDEMIWNLNIAAELPKISGFPKVIFPNMTSVFGAIDHKRAELPVWDDELYLEYHRGTLTSQEEVKRQNRRLEAHLHNVEWLTVIANAVCGADIDFAKTEIAKIWEDTLLFQFHDALPGSSNNEVIQDIIRRGQPHLERLRALENEMADIIEQNLEDDELKSPCVLFNTLGHPRFVNGQFVPSGGWARSDVSTPVFLDTQHTTTYEIFNSTEKSRHRLVEPFFDTTHPAISSDRIHFDPVAKSVTTPFFVVIFSESGHIESVRSRADGREFLSGPGNQFELYEDRPIAWPAWDIQLYHKEMQIEGPVLDSIEFEDNCIVTTHTIPNVVPQKANRSTIRQTITFSADSPTIDFKTIVRWTVHDKLLKVAFPTTVRARSARFGIQFGHIERPTHNNTARDLAKFESAGRWADLSDRTAGISLCSDVKAGFDIHGNVMRLSLLKSPLQPDQWADYGLRKFTYRAVFHEAFDAAQITKLSDELNTPVVLHDISPHEPGPLPNEAAFVVITDPNIILETLKPAFDSDGFIARLFEATGGHRTTNVTFPLLPSRSWHIQIVDLLENPSSPINRLPGRSLAFSYSFRSFELLSLLLTRAR
jgi:alpha-mannosidase